MILQERTKPVKEVPRDLAKLVSHASALPTLISLSIGTLRPTASTVVMVTHHADAHQARTATYIPQTHGDAEPRPTQTMPIAHSRASPVEAGGQKLCRSAPPRPHGHDATSEREGSFHHRQLDFSHQSESWCKPLL
jgi:hypothetical protein